MRKMSRVLIALTLLVMCFFMTLSVSAYTVEFNTDGNLEGVTLNSHISDGKVENGNLYFKTNNTDSQIYINKKYDYVNKTGGIINADECESLEIRFSTTQTEGYFEIFFTSVNPENGEWFCKPWESGDKSEQSYVSNSRIYKFNGSGSLDDYITLTIDRTEVTYWKGIVSSFRIDPCTKTDIEFKIDYIKFIGGDLTPEEPEEPEVPAAPATKAQWVVDEEELYGECLFFDDFESYALNAVPSTVYYSKAGSTGMAGADQCKEYKVVTGIGGNDTKLVELISKGSYKYPMLNVSYKLTDDGQYTVLMDAYTTATVAQKWAFHNGFTCDPAISGDNRIRDESNLVVVGKWQTPKAVHGTDEKPNLVSINYFRYGAGNIVEDEKIYIDNIRAYFKPYRYATVNAGGGEGTATDIRFVQNSTLTLPACPFTKEGYSFDGWKTSLGSKIYDEGEKVEIGNVTSLTITATWSKFRPVTVRKNSIRTTTESEQGLRFAAYVTNENKADADEYGFIVTTAALLGDNELTFGENTSDTAGVTPDGIRYVYGTAYDKAKGIDKVFSTSGEVFGSEYWKKIEGCFFTGVLTKIPEAAYCEKMVVRPYAKVEGTYSYGETIVRSIRDIAQNAYDSGNREAYVMNILEKTFNRPNTKVCFLGDSITHRGLFIDELYEYYLKSDKKMGRLEMYNLGISGDTAGGALKRIDDDVMYHDPDVVVIMLGMNDITGGLYKKGEYSEEIEAKRQANLETYKTNMTAIIDKLEGYGVEVVLCTPTPYDDVTDTVYERSVGLGKCAEWLREVAAERGYKLIDHFANMYPICSQKYIGSDFVHPNALGHHLMAQSVLLSLGYIDEMELDTPVTSYIPANEERGTLAYNFRMMVMVERTLRGQGYTDIDAKKTRAAELRDAQSSDHWRWIYQNYIDTVEDAVETRERIIHLTEELSYKD